MREKNGSSTPVAIGRNNLLTVRAESGFFFKIIAIKTLLAKLRIFKFEVLLY
jgi:hypothetical protein